MCGGSVAFVLLVDMLCMFATLKPVLKLVRRQTENRCKASCSQAIGPRYNVAACGCSPRPQLWLRSLVHRATDDNLVDRLRPIPYTLYPYSIHITLPSARCSHAQWVDSLATRVICTQPQGHQYNLT